MRNPAPRVGKECREGNILDGIVRYGTDGCMHAWTYHGLSHGAQLDGDEPIVDIEMGEVADGKGDSGAVSRRWRRKIFSECQS